MISMGPVALILVVSGNCSYCTSPKSINPTFSSFFVILLFVISGG